MIVNYNRHMFIVQAASNQWQRKKHFMEDDDWLGEDDRHDDAQDEQNGPKNPENVWTR
jgi:hypothetical protein